MKGKTGTPMGGPRDSKKWAIRKNLVGLIKAQDILRLLDKGERDIQTSLIALCEKAVTMPSFLEPYEVRKIMHNWYLFAEQGKLRGIRTKKLS